jgi:membrane fusion protein, multidrug efflux system
MTETIVNPIRPCIAALALTLPLLVCGCGSNAADTSGAAAPAPPAIDVVHVVEQPLDVKLSLPGELVPYQSVAIFPRATGFVKAVNVDRGAVVPSGALLARLEAPELLAQHAEAQSKLQAAEADLAALRARADADAGTYERLRSASATPGVVAGNDLLHAQKTVEADQNQLSAAQQRIEAARQAANALREMEGYLRLTAPFAGVVTERNIHPGALVGPSSGASSLPLFRLVDHARLRLVVPVPEPYTAKMAVGTVVPFSVAAYPNQPFSGKVARIAQAIDATTRTMAVELDVANQDARLSPGTFCQVQWPVTRPGPSLLVPSSSVASTTDRTFLIRVRDGKTQWVDVKTGLSTGRLVEVFGDIHAGDTVAVRGTDELRPDTNVRVKETKPVA